MTSDVVLPEPTLAELGVVERTSEQGRVIVLPQRAPQRGAGVFLTVFGLAFAGFPAVLLVKVVFDAVGGTAGWPDLLLGVFALPFMVIGLGLALLGQGMFASHTELEVTADELRVRERLGLATWRARRPLAAWRRVVLGAGPELAERTLRVEFDGVRSVLVAPGYSPELLRALATELARIGASAGASGELSLPPLLPTEPRAREAAEDALLELAPQSDLVVERRDEAILIHVPPRGAWKGSRGLFGVGLAFVGVFVVFVGAAIVHPAVRQVPLLIGAPFCAVLGAAMTAGGWVMGRREETLAATRTKLVIERVSPFGKRRHEWKREELEDVRIGPSGMSINEVPIQELQVKARGRAKLGLLTQREDAEIRWIARELRRALYL